jgi:hypothetical protein
MLILGIETSCDETAAAVVEDGRHAHSNVVASQIDLHKQYGGVIPEIAARSHIEVILPVIHETLDEAGFQAFLDAGFMTPSASSPKATATTPGGALRQRPRQQHRLAYRLFLGIWGTQRPH